MGKKLYVGNLPYSMTDSALSDLFSQSGTVESARVITDPATGRSKGFGFVEMTSDQEADDCINRLNGSDCEGRAIIVSEARPQQPRDQRGPRGGGRFGNGGGGGGRRNFGGGGPRGGDRY